MAQVMRAKTAEEFRRALARRAARDQIDKITVYKIPLIWWPGRGYWQLPGSLPRGKRWMRSA